MANLDRNLTVLLHMQTYCIQISKTLERFDNSFENFINDSDFQDSISMKIFQIGELVNHLTMEYIEETKKAINWNDIRGMRNRFAHGYADMDKKVIYYTAKKDVVVLEKFLEIEIKRLLGKSKEE